LVPNAPGIPQHFPRKEALLSGFTWTSGRFLDMLPERLCGLREAELWPEDVDFDGYVPFRPSCRDEIARGKLISDQAFGQPRRAAAGLSHGHQQFCQM